MKLLVACALLCLMFLGLEAVPFDEATKEDRSGVPSAKDTTDPSLWIEPVNGLKVNYANQELVKYSPHSKREKAAISKRKKGNHKSKKPDFLTRIGTFLMMIPVGMQLLQLPMAIASVKFSLLKSILVAKAALVMLILRAILQYQASQHQKLVFVRPPPKQYQYHEHYYHPFEDPEDSKPGWLGIAPPSWLT